MSLDKVYADLGQSEFSIGLIYVALSRCKKIEGLYLSGITQDRLKQISRLTASSAERIWLDKYLNRMALETI